MDFFSKIFNHKKILFFACLFLFVFAFSLTANINTAHAANCTATTFSSCVCNGQVCTLHNDVTGLGNNGKYCSKDADCSKEAPVALTCELTFIGKMEQWTADILASSFMPFMTSALWITKQLSLIATNLTSYSINLVMSWHITVVTAGDNWPLVWINGWTEMRDIANMIIVLGFIVAAIAIALRIQEYGAKKFLLPLIIVAILINFSGLFCGLIIDASTLVYNGLTNQVVMSGSTNFNTASEGTTILNIVQTAEANLLCQATYSKGLDGLGKYYMTEIYFVFIYFYLAVAFWYLLWMVIDRYIILGFLFMLSPLAFVAKVIPNPGAQKLWNMWIDNFLKQAFIGVGLAFVLYTAAQMLSKLNITPSMSILDVGFYLSIVLTVIIVGTKMTAVTSTYVGQFVKGVAKVAWDSAVFAGQIALAVATGGSSAAAMGGLKGAAMKAGGAALSKATGGKTAEMGTSVMSRFGQMAEKFGLKREGSTDTATRARVAEKAKQTSTVFSAAKERRDAAYNLGTPAGDATVAREEATLNRIRAKARAGDTASIQAVVENKDLKQTFKGANGIYDANGPFDQAAASRAILQARANGAVDISDKAYKQAPALAGEDKVAVDRVLTSQGLDPKTISDTDPRRADAKQEVIVRVAIKTPKEELDRSFADSMKSGTFDMAVRAMEPQKQQSLKAATRQSMDDQQKALSSIIRNKQQDDEMRELKRKILTLDSI